jgi:hypothetical protein
MTLCLKRLGGVNAENPNEFVGVRFTHPAFGRFVVLFALDGEQGVIAERV